MQLRCTVPSTQRIYRYHALSARALSNEGGVVEHELRENKKNDSHRRSSVSRALRDSTLDVPEGVPRLAECQLHGHEELHAVFPTRDALAGVAAKATPIVLVDRVVPELAHPAPRAVAIAAFSQIDRAIFLDDGYEVAAVSDEPQRDEHTEGLHAPLPPWLAFPIHVRVNSVVPRRLGYRLLRLELVQHDHGAHHHTNEGTADLRGQGLVICFQGPPAREHIGNDHGNDHDEQHDAVVLPADVQSQIREVHADHGVATPHTTDADGVRIVHGPEQGAADDAHLED
mmetsp:Transcript_66481/g.191919  ORF Transcript_66481/g.191919 Transcript_66481/m.191919 type:complete len:285 (-) Transcript_66481:854-1708(-)